METIWLRVYADEVMTIDFVTFIEFLNVNKMNYKSYHSRESEIIMEVVGNMTIGFNKQLSQFIYYRPIIQLDEEPYVSDDEIIEEMSNVDWKGDIQWQRY